MDCEENVSGSAVDVGSNSRADDGGEKETDGLLGACAQRERLGKDLSVWYGGREKNKKTTEEEVYSWNKGTDRIREDEWTIETGRSLKYIAFHCSQDQHWYGTSVS